MLSDGGVLGLDKAATSILSSDRLMVLPMTITINVF